MIYKIVIHPEWNNLCIEDFDQSQHDIRNIDIDLINIWDRKNSILYLLIIATFSYL